MTLLLRGTLERCKESKPFEQRKRGKGNASNIGFATSLHLIIFTVTFRLN
jgi:hypothetical protein